MKKLSSYEDRAIAEIAIHMIDPSLFHETLALIGKPVELALKIPKVGPTIQKGINLGLKGTISASHLFYGDETILGEYKKNNIVTTVENISTLDLEAIDKVADSFKSSGKLMVGAEGAILGLAASFSHLLPGSQLAVVGMDIAASFTFLSRHACCVCLSFGLDPRDPRNLVHILSSMIPLANSTDEGFLAAKLEALAQIRQAADYILKAREAAASAEMLQKVLNTPAFVRFLEMIAARLGVAITEKEIAMLVPAVGAVLNGGVNVAFLHYQHQTALDYHRKLYLERKYGEDFIHNEVEKAKIKYKPKAA